MRTVEDDVAASDAVAASFFIFELADDFGDGTFAVEDAADGVEVVRFVAPGESGVRVTALEGFTRAANFLAQRAFGENKERGAVTSGEIGHRHAIDALADVVIKAVCIAVAIRGTVLAAEMAGDGWRRVWEERLHGRMR